ncbi:MAG: pentapeptide repeat-containing protein [Roseovarius indicus]
MLVLFAFGALLTTVLGAFQHWKNIASLLSIFPWKRASKITNALSLMALITIGPAAAGLFVLAVVDAYSLLGTESGSGTATGSFGRGAVIVALIGAPFVVWRSIVAQKTVNITEQGHITDRINTAVVGLGAEKTVRTHRKNRQGDLLFHEKEGTPEDLNTDKEDPTEDKKVLDYKRPVIVETTEPNLEVRIGAIYALERIAQDSDRDHVQIMEILCAYVRGNATASEATSLQPVNVLTAPQMKWLPGGTQPRADIQTAISVIGRRTSTAIGREREEGYRLDLTDCNLQNVHFDTGDGQWSQAIFDGSKLDQAKFSNCNCIGTSFENCSLENTDFSETKLDHARLDHAEIRYVQISRHAKNVGLLNSIRILATVFEYCRFEELDIENQFHNGSVKKSTFQRCLFQHHWFFEKTAGLEPKDCVFAGCAIRNCRFDPSMELHVDLDNFFGDGTSTVPNGTRPHFWPVSALSEPQFREEWRKWQINPDSYRLPAPPGGGAR